MDIEQIRQKEGARALAWLEKHWPRNKRVCPICENNNWAIGTPVEMRTFNGGAMVLGGPQSGVMPIFTAMCERCGYVHMFHALFAGVVTVDEYHEQSGDSQ